MQRQIIQPVKKEINCDEKLFENNGLIARIFHGGNDDGCKDHPFRTQGYAVMLVTRGTIGIRIDFTESVFRQRDLLFFFPNSVYEISQDTDVSYICVQFSKSYLRNKGIFFNTGESYKVSLGNPGQRFSLTREEYAFIYYDMLALHKKLNVHKDRPMIGNMVHNSFLELLYDLYLINDKNENHVSINHDSKAELTNRFMDLLAKNFIREKRVNYYADSLGITPRHLSQVVKQVTNKTAGELIDEMITKQAKLLLTSHGMNVSEVAAALEFSTSSFFGKYFKKQTGQSPLLWKSAHIVA